MRARQGALRAASRRPQVALAGGLRASGMGVDCQRMRGRKGSYRISRTSYCRAAGFLSVQFWGGGVLWAVTALRRLGRRKPEAVRGGNASSQSPGSRLAQGRGLPGAQKPTRLPPFLPLFLSQTLIGPGDLIGHWRFVDEYDMVLDLNVFVAHNL